MYIMRGDDKIHMSFNPLIFFDVIYESRQVLIAFLIPSNMLIGSYLELLVMPNQTDSNTENKIHMTKTSNYSFLALLFLFFQSIVFNLVL
jgi:hypothetical protein